MNIRPFRHIERRKSRKIKVGDVFVGGDAPITVQTMTNTLTTDVDATLEQIFKSVEAGADIIRISCPDKDSTKALKKIVEASPVPIVADIHFQYKLALAAIEAGVQGLRLNPGNIRNEDQIKQIAKECLSANIPIRIGVNAGSLDKDLLEKFGEATPEALVESASVSYTHLTLPTN